MDENSLTIPQIATFLEYLFVDENLNPGTIGGYKTALVDFFTPEILPIQDDPAISRLLSGFIMKSFLQLIGCFPGI